MGEGQRHGLAALLPGKETRYLLYKKLGGPHGRSGRVRKISTTQGFDPRTVQPVASPYTDYSRTQDRQCTYNVTLRRHRTTIVAAEKKWVLHNPIGCICSLSYPARNAHAPYDHVAWPAVQHFFNIISQTLRFPPHPQKKITEHQMCVSSTTFIWNTFRSKNIWARYDRKCTIGLHVKYRLFVSDFNENWIFAADFRKILKYKISWISVQWEPSCSLWTDGQTWRR